MVSQETLKALTRADLPEGKYFDAHLPSEMRIKMKSDWREIRPIQERRNKLSPNWPSLLAKYIRESNPHCPISFKWHKVKLFGSRKSTGRFLFSAFGRCRFENCSVTCKLHLKKDSRELCIKYTGKVHHRTDKRKARYIRGQERADLKEEFEHTHKKPSTVYNKKVDEMSSQSIAAGNRTGAGACKAASVTSRQTPGGVGA